MQRLGKETLREMQDCRRVLAQRISLWTSCSLSWQIAARSSRSWHSRCMRSARPQRPWPSSCNSAKQLRSSQARRSPAAQQISRRTRHQHRWIRRKQPLKQCLPQNPPRQQLQSSRPPKFCKPPCQLQGC